MREVCIFKGGPESKLSLLHIGLIFQQLGGGAGLRLSDVFLIVEHGASYYSGRVPQ
jgi:hypothetical protein